MPRTPYTGWMALIDAEPPFCETGCLLAVQFQRTAAAAVEQAHTRHSMTLQAAVLDSLREFVEHVQGCAKCGA